MKSKCTLLLAFVTTALCLPAQAELQPSQVAVIVNSSSAQSNQIGDYYAQKRGVPANQVLKLPIPMGETLSRADWDTKVRPAIRNWVSKNRLQNTIKCFVTTWDVPLKIGKTDPAKLSLAVRRRKALLELERKRRVERLLKIAQDFDKIEGTPMDVQLTSAAKLDEVSNLLRDKLRAAEARINGMSDGESKQTAIRTLTQLSIATAGLKVILQNMRSSLQAGTIPQQNRERISAEFQLGSGRLGGLSEGQTLLDGLPATIERDTNLIALIERSTGIAGSVAWIDGQLDLLEKNETHTSFDSELALVLEGSYPLLRWLPNYLHYNYDGSPLRQITRTLMVCRLEAPTFELTQGLIDKAIAVEQTGLKGKVYLDARGLKIDGSVRPGTIEDFDRSLVMAEQFFRNHTNLEVTINNLPTLFGENECPDTALYCGWYSLSKYVPAFTWNPGSIGYHMASGEASTIRNSESQVWCKKILDGGAAGTYGPVFEPYLLAFPRPNEFFALLCSGKYTYAECWYRTKVTNSWTMTAIGDPLYNPFKNAPAITSEPKEPLYQKLFGLTAN